MATRVSLDTLACCRFCPGRHLPLAGYNRCLLASRIPYLLTFNESKNQTRFADTCRAEDYHPVVVALLGHLWARAVQVPPSPVAFSLCASFCEILEKSGHEDVSERQDDDVSRRASSSMGTGQIRSQANVSFEGCGACKSSGTERARSAQERSKTPSTECRGRAWARARDKLTLEGCENLARARRTRERTLRLPFAQARSEMMRFAAFSLHTRMRCERKVFTEAPKSQLALP